MSEQAIDQDKVNLDRRLSILENQVKQLEAEFRQYRVQFYDRLNKDTAENRLDELAKSLAHLHRILGR